MSETKQVSGMDSVDAFGMGFLFLTISALIQALLFALGCGADTLVVSSIAFAFGNGFVFVRELLKVAKKYPMPPMEGK